MFNSPSTMNTSSAKTSPPSSVTTDMLTEGFLRRSLRMTAALILVGSIYSLVYVGQWQALAFLSAGVWGLVNMLFIKTTIEALIKPGKVDKIAVFGLLVIKFPVLYLSGYGLLSFGRFEAPYLLAGFSLFFVVVALKAVGRALTGLDGQAPEVKRESFLS
jgi:hypothetical protein